MSFSSSLSRTYLSSRLGSRARNTWSGRRCCCVTRAGRCPCIRLWLPFDEGGVSKDWKVTSNALLQIVTDGESDLVDEEEVTLAHHERDGRPFGYRPRQGALRFRRVLRVRLVAPCCNRPSSCRAAGLLAGHPAIDRFVDRIGVDRADRRLATRTSFSAGVVLCAKFSISGSPTRQM